MKKWRNLSLNLKLMACFLSAIFVLSAFHLGSYMRLLNTMTHEAEASANERMTSAVTRLDESLSHIRNSYFSLTYTPAFRTASRSGDPSEYELVDLYDKAELYLGNNENISAFAIFFRNSSKVVTSSGNYLDTEFFSRYYTSTQYDANFWREEKLAAFAQRYYPAAAFSRNSPLSTRPASDLLPVAFKPYWNSNIMVLLFLDIDALCAEADQYLTEDFYLFSTDGRMLYSAQEEPVLTALPERKDALFEAPEGGYTAQRPSSHGDFIYLKQLPKNTVVGQITNSLYFSLFTAAAALIFGAAIAVVSVWRVLHPVQDILQLFSSGDAPPSGKVDELHYIQANVETMLRQREQYVQQISKKDAALSGFLLQSQLKNIYVELDVPDQISSAEDLVFYILYFRIHYRNGALDTITAEPPAVSHMLLENLRQTLSLLFGTALIFQLEPNQFVAKVSLPAARQDISDQMQYLLQRLDNEREFAFFTVVQSGALGADGDFTAIYDQVLDAAQYAVVEDRTQLLHLPLGLDVVNTFFFPSEMEQQLRALVCDGHSDEAAALAERIIAQNLSAGIRRIHMILLGSAIANVTLRALSDLHLEGGLPNLNSGSVYNELPQCDTAQDYRELMSGFVRSAALCAAAQPRAEEPILEGVQAFLEKNYQREFSMDELAEALHLSKSYLSTYYKSKTGANLSDRIQFFRIQKAVELLADPKLRIGDIGALVGINNVNTFLRQFKKYTGMTPREYRLRKLSMQ